MCLSLFTPSHFLTLSVLPSFIASPCLPSLSLSLSLSLSPSSCIVSLIINLLSSVNPLHTLLIIAPSWYVRTISTSSYLPFVQHPAVYSVQRPPERTAFPHESARGRPAPLFVIDSGRTAGVKNLAQQPTEASIQICFQPTLVRNTLLSALTRENGWGDKACSASQG